MTVKQIIIAKLEPHCSAGWTLASIFRISSTWIYTGPEFKSKPFALRERTQHHNVEDSPKAAQQICLGHMRSNENVTSYKWANHFKSHLSLYKWDLYTWIIKLQWILSRNEACNTKARLRSILYCMFMSLPSIYKGFQTVSSTKRTSRVCGCSSVAQLWGKTQ